MSHDFVLNRYAHCLFCDDIRGELHNKVSFMGVLGTDLYVLDSAPIIPRICAVITFVAPIADVPNSVRFEIAAPGISPLITDQEKWQAPNGREDAVMAIATAKFALNNYEVKEEGLIEAFVETDSDRLLAGRMRLHKVDQFPISPSS